MLNPFQTPFYHVVEGGEVHTTYFWLKTNLELLHSVKNTIKKTNLVRKFVSEWSLSISRIKG